jgi:hypothetical protein
MTTATRFIWQLRHKAPGQQEKQSAKRGLAPHQTPAARSLDINRKHVLKTKELTTNEEACT